MSFAIVVVVVVVVVVVFVVSAVSVVLMIEGGTFNGSDTTVDGIVSIDDIVTTGDVIGVVTVEVDAWNIVADTTVGNRSGTLGVDGNAALVVVIGTAFVSAKSA